MDARIDIQESFFQFFFGPCRRVRWFEIVVLLPFSEFEHVTVHNVISHVLGRKCV